MHTPEQAKELWCPMARIARDETVRIESPAIGGMFSVHEERYIVGGCNRDAIGGMGSSIKSCRCIADKCAMWRWAETERKALMNVKPNQGYCGLAGQVWSQS